MTSNGTKIDEFQETRTIEYITPWHFDPIEDRMPLIFSITLIILVATMITFSQDMTLNTKINLIGVFGLGAAMSFGLPRIGSYDRWKIKRTTVTADKNLCTPTCKQCRLEKCAITGTARGFRWRL